MITVACVLRSGGSYDATYVRRLRAGVEHHLERPHQFVCLTDVVVPGAETAPLEHDWPGWWSKIELFRPGLFSGRVLYLDLDTEIVGGLDEIASFAGHFAMIDDWLRPTFGASGVMVWDADRANLHDIYEPFVRNPEGCMRSHRGDQNWIGGSVAWKPLRAIYPGQIVSRWEECTTAVPPNARIVCYHGTPKPHEIGWSLVGTREAARKQVAA